MRSRPASLAWDIGSVSVAASALACQSVCVSAEVCPDTRHDLPHYPPRALAPPSSKIPCGSALVLLQFRMYLLTRSMEIVSFLCPPVSQSQRAVPPPDVQMILLVICLDVNAPISTRLDYKNAWHCRVGLGLLLAREVPSPCRDPRLHLHSPPRRPVASSRPDQALRCATLAPCGPGTPLRYALLRCCLSRRRLRQAHRKGIWYRSIILIYTPRQSKISHATKPNDMPRAPRITRATRQSMAADRVPTGTRLRASQAWTPEADTILLEARSRGLGWKEIADEYFSNGARPKTNMACRKHWERLIYRQNQELWVCERLLQRIINKSTPIFDDHCAAYQV